MLRREEGRPDGRDKMGILLATGLLFVPFLSCLILETCSSNTEVPAATPVDIYQDMESGSSGDPLTSALMNASNYGSGSWDPMAGTMWVSNNNSRSLPGPVVVGGTTYPGKGGTRSWVFLDAFDWNFVTTMFPSDHSKVTVACYLTAGPTCLFGNQFDTLTIEGPSIFSVLQIRGEDSGGPYLRAHSCIAGSESTFSASQIKVIAGKTYWVNLQYDGPAGKTRVAAYDPDNGFAQVGPILVADSVTNAGIRYFSCGRSDTHGDNPDCATQSYLDNIIIDYTDGKFPLIPGIATAGNYGQ
jgi:hypothetical protein